MREKRSRIALWSTITMLFMAVFAVAVTTFVLYRTSFEQTRNQLEDTVKSHASLIEAVARFNKQQNQNDQVEATITTLGQIIDAHQKATGFGETGEFTLATLKDKTIHFLLSHRHYSENPSQVPMFGTNVAEPMRLALKGHSGTIIAPDYRGETVLAAYQPVPELDSGIVAKIDLAEIRHPFLFAGAVSALVAFLMTWIAAVVVVRPLASRATDNEGQISAINKSQMKIEFGMDGIIITANENFLEVMGYTLAEITGRHHSMFIDPELSNSETYREFWQQLNEGEYVSAELRRVSKAGKDIWIQASYNPILDPAGNPCKVVKYSFDITDRVLSDLALKKAQAGLAKSKEAAELANIAKSEFLANMSHEIRTPMTAILGFTDILLGNLVEPENIQSATTIKENGEYLLDLINDILNLSKIESGKLEVEQVVFSPHQIIADVVSLMRIRAQAKGLALEMRLDGLIPETICSDPTRLRQILINVVGNAIKFTETGAIQIVTRLMNLIGEETQLQVDVIDTGIGIPSDKIEKIFNPFTQADGSTTRIFGGTGLGLCISKRLSELLGGKLSVSSTVGKGSVFSITVSTGSLNNVKLIHDPVDLVSNQVDVQSNDETEFTLHNYRVLLAEDGPDNQRLISFVLKKAGAEVVLAGNGQIAFDLAIAANSEGRPFDVILMDMQMPVMDGYSATKQLRDEGYIRPIIALTAHAMESDRQKCINAGCDEYTTKPIDRKKLVRLVADAPKQVQV